MKKNTVTKIFIFFLIFLPLQYAVVGIVGLKKSEPWPALVFPAFKSVLNNVEKLTKTEPLLEVEAASGRYQLVKAKLLHGLMPLQQREFLENNFSKSEQLTKSTIEWIKDRIGATHPEIQDPEVLYVNWIEQKYTMDRYKLEPVAKRTTRSFKIQL